MPLNAKLHIETALRQQRTVVRESFCTQPFKVANITEKGSSGELRLMLMSSSPGVLDGDHYQIEIDVREGCSLALETQSYQRIFQMQKGATQEMIVHLQDGSSFTYLPHPVVPHRKSIFNVRNKIFLQNHCSLIWGEVISCGRKMNGEVFQFSLYHGITEIYVNGKLAVKENLMLKPAVVNLASIGQLEGFTHQASLIYLSEKADVAKMTNQLLGVLHERNDVSFGVTALPVNGVLVRLLGHKAEPLFNLLKDLSLLLQGTGVNTIKKETHVC